MKYRLIITLLGVAVLSAAASFVALKPRATRLSVTPRAGDDTVVVNQTHRTRLNSLVLDQYGRRIRSDTAVTYRWLAGDSIRLSSNGDVQCANRGEATVRAMFGHVIQEFVLRCRPVVSIDAPSWIDLVVGDSARDLAFVAYGPDGRPVTELRGAVSVEDRSVIAAEGTTIRPKRAGQTFAAIEVGNVRKAIPIAVYQLVKSFANDGAKRTTLMAMRVTLARGDTINVPLPTAAFWVTYFSKNRGAAPPTIELQGEGSCTTGNGLTQRRIEEGQYAKYCLARHGTRMMIAHGTSGAPNVSGTVAIRVMQ